MVEITIPQLPLGLALAAHPLECLDDPSGSRRQRCSSAPGVRRPGFGNTTAVPSSGFFNIGGGASATGARAPGVLSVSDPARIGFSPASSNRGACLRCTGALACHLDLVSGFGNDLIYAPGLKASGQSPHGRRCVRRMGGRNFAPDQAFLCAGDAIAARSHQVDCGCQVIRPSRPALPLVNIAHGSWSPARAPAQPFVESTPGDRPPGRLTAEIAGGIPSAPEPPTVVVQQALRRCPAHPAVSAAPRSTSAPGWVDGNHVRALAGWSACGAAPRSSAATDDGFRLRAPIVAAAKRQGRVRRRHAPSRSAQSVSGGSVAHHAGSRRVRIDSQPGAAGSRSASSCRLALVGDAPPAPVRGRGRRRGVGASVNHVCRLEPG